MTTLEEQVNQDAVDNDQKPCGHGRMLRKEDPRFIRGRGTYVDDVALPGMLHLRSCVRRSPTRASSASTRLRRRHIRKSKPS